MIYFIIYISFLTSDGISKQQSKFMKGRLFISVLMHLHSFSFDINLMNWLFGRKSKNVIAANRFSIITWD